MTTESSRPTADPAAPSDRLDSWKEIAAYLKRDVTTVRRWEKREGLPVHRHQHAHRDSIYAFTAEIDAWWQGRRNQLATNGVSNGAVNGSTNGSASGQPRRNWMPVVAAASFLSVFAVAAALVLGGRGVSVSADEFRFPLAPADHASFGTLAVSPDGRHIAFTATSAEGTTLLWLRPLNDVNARPLLDTNGAAFPFWSPTSDAVGFFADGKLWTMSIAGGIPRVIAEAPEGRGASWNRDATIVFAPTREGPLYRVADTGGPTRPVTTVLSPGERGHLWPEFLPDGVHFVYLADSAQRDHHNVFVGALDGQPPKHVMRLTSNVVYSSRTGHLLFERERQLMAQAFDVRRLTLSGEPFRVAGEVLQQWGLDHKTDVSVSTTGIVAYRAMRTAGDARLVWRDREQRDSVLLDAPAEYNEPTLSPDESRIAIDIFDRELSKRFGFGPIGVTSDIWIVDRSTGKRSQFTSDPGAEFDPVWSPDGQRIVYSSNRNGTLDLFIKDVNAASPGELYFGSPLDKHAQAWSPDGRFIIFRSYALETRSDLWLLPTTPRAVATKLLESALSEDNARISPDGRWFVYSQYVGERSEVYVQKFPVPGPERWQISTGGGGDAQWSRDGRELFYLADDRSLMAVPVTTGATFTHGKPVALFDTGMTSTWNASRNHFDVTRDGTFLLMAPVVDDRAAPFTIVLNWAPK
jgi:Tol biopolymer transport system component